MKRVLYIFMPILFSFLLTLNTFALKNYGRYLEIENGKSEIILCAGERTHLKVSSYFFGFPIYKNISYSSSNKFIVTVDDSGIANANMCGTAYITVTDEKGRTDSIRVRVQGKKKAGILGITIVIAGIIGIILALIKIKPVLKNTG